MKARFSVVVHNTNTIHGSLKHFGGATRVGRDTGVNTIHRSLKSCIRFHDSIHYPYMNIINRILKQPCVGLCWSWLSLKH